MQRGGVAPAAVPADRESTGQTDDCAWGQDEPSGEGGRQVVQLYGVAPGRHLELEHQSGEALEWNRSTVDAGVPPGNVGEAKAQDLRAVGVNDELPRRRIRVS